MQRSHELSPTVEAALSTSDRSSPSTTPLYAWGVWILGTLFMFFKYAIEVSPSVMTQHLMRSFSIGATKLGHLTGCYFYAYLLMQIPAGILIDTFGPRVVTSLAILFCSFGTYVFAHATDLTSACIGRLLMGTGAAFAALNCLKLIALWFPPRRMAFMAGLMMSIAMLGAVGGQAPLSYYIESMGWREAMQGMTWIGCLLALLFWFVVRNRPAQIVPPSQLEAQSARTTFLRSCTQIFRNPQCWWLSLYSGLAFAPVCVFGGLWGVPFLSQAYGLATSTATQMISLIFIGFAAGAPLAGWISERAGQRKPIMMWGTLLAMLSVSVVILSPSLPPLLLGILLFTFGAAISCFLPCFTMIQEINLPIFSATAVGFMNVFDSFLGGVSDPLTGLFLDVGWQGHLINGVRYFPTSIYRLALLTLPIYLCLAMLFLYRTKETYCKRIVSATE